MSEIDLRIKDLQTLMTSMDWGYPASDSSGHYQRSSQMEADICRESYRLRELGFVAEVDQLWERLGPPQGR